jgi:hypothetical protein
MSATILSPRQFAEDAPVFAWRTTTPRQAVRGTPVLGDEYMHPAVIGFALGGFVLFLAASWIGWAVGYTALLIGVISFLGLMYFGPLVACGRMSAEFRGEVSQRSFARFLAGRVRTFTGTIRGSEALMQIAFMPIALGCVMCVFAAMWLSMRG